MRSIHWLTAALTAASCPAVAAPVQQAPAVLGITRIEDGETTVPGPVGPLAGTLIDKPRGAPAVLILPGSGPTDRNGDNVMGVKGGVYRQLAEGLSARGIATLRIDKRGIGGSARASANPNNVTIADYVADTRKWFDLLHAKHPCVWLAGHSEGGLIALAAASQMKICGLMLIAAPGRKLDAVLREQLAPLPAEPRTASYKAIGELAAGRRVDPASVPAGVRPLFNPATQGYLIDMIRQDPAAMAARVRVPMLIVQGSEDLQVTPTDAAILAKAQPRAKLAPIAGMNHVFRIVPAKDRVANLNSYADASKPIAPALVDTIAAFIKRGR